MKIKEIMTESIDNFVDSLIQKYNIHDLSIFDKGDTLILSSIIVPKNMRKQGIGSMIMHDIINYADKLNKKIVLTPGVKDKHHGTTSKTRLIKFYKKFGFVENKGKSIDFSIGAGKMVRYPKLSETPLPTDWDSAVYNPVTSFKKRIEYTVAKAQKLGKGSSRTTFEIEYQGRPTVLKIAHNKKGAAQNEEEVRILDDYYIKGAGITIPLIDYDDNHTYPTWIHLEKATKVNKKTLCNLLKTPNLDTLVEFTYARFHYQNTVTVNKINSYLKDTLHYTDEDINTFHIYSDKLYMLHDSFELELNDFRIINNWGVYNGHPIIIDLGFTKTVAPLYGYK